MSKAADLRRRLDAITAAMSGTLDARQAELTPAERSIYDRWKAGVADYHRQSDTPASSYQRLLSGDHPPALAESVSTALFGRRPIVTADMTDADAAEAFRHFALGVRE
jgi:hypothetical protein